AARADNPAVAPAAIEPGEEGHRILVIGVGLFLADIEFRVEILVELDEIRLDEGDREFALDLGDGEIGPQLLAIAEEIAMLPEILGADALARRIARAETDGAVIALGKDQRDRDDFALDERPARLEMNAVEKAAAQIAPAQIINHAGIIENTGLPLRETADVVLFDLIEPLDRQIAEIEQRAGVDGERDFHRIGRKINDGVLLLNRRVRIAVMGEIGDDIGGGIHHGLGPRSHAHLDSQLGKCGLFREFRRALEVYIELGDAENRARLDLKADLRGIRAAVELVGHLRRIIAFRLQDFQKARDIRIGAAAKRGEARRRPVLKLVQAR